MSTRGYLTMSAREAEELNRDLARTGARGSVFMFVPEIASTKPATTQKICTDRHGNLIRSMAGRAHMPGGPSHIGMVPSGSRKRSSGDGLPQQAMTGGPPLLQHQRSKRQKVSMQPTRLSSGAPKKETADMRPCQRVLRDLMRHQNAWPFKSPVDINRYPDYYDFVKDPICLDTIKKRLDANEYLDPEDFANDVRKVWSNCFLYNKEGTDVHAMAKELQALFEKSFDDLPPQSTDPLANEQMKNMQKQMKMMQKQMEMQMMMLKQQNELSTTTTQMALNQGLGLPMAAPNFDFDQGLGLPMAAPKHASASNMKAGGSRSRHPMSQQRHASAPPVLLPPPRDENAEMTWEDKKHLGAAINKMNSHNLGKVVQIIKASMPVPDGGEGEIEVDINSLDNKTLWKLHSFVQRCAPKKKAKRPAQTSASSRAALIERAQADSQGRLAEISAARAAAHARSGGVGGGGIQLERQTSARDDDDFSDSDDDDDGLNALTVPSSQAPGGSAAFAEFQRSQALHNREREDAGRRQIEAARSQAERQRLQKEQHAAAVQRQRAAERASYEQDAGDVDMLGQSHAMASFEQDFELDPYGAA